MTRFVLLGLLALGGCATTATAPVAVTRFSLAADVARGAVLPVAGADTLEQRGYEDSVARALARVGFTGGSAQSARYAFTADVARDVRTAPPRRSPVTIGIGGGTGGYGGGVGVGASFGVGKRRVETIAATRLSVQLRDRATGQVVWEGRAETSGAAGAGDVDRLAQALFRDFPGESGRTISVP